MGGLEDLTIAVVGATGAVGAEFLRIVEQRYAPGSRQAPVTGGMPRLRLMASKRSAGKRIAVGGEELVVDTGHLVAFSDDVDYSIGKVGGIRSLIGGGEGLVMRFRGNGHVWVQTRNLAALADKLTPFLPQPRGQ